MATRSRDYSIAVVGGGIGGLCCAIGLMHQGVPVTIYEAASAFAEIGAGVSLGPNAARAMSMIDPKIIKGFQKCVTNNAYPENQKYWFQFRKGQDRSSFTGTHVYNLVCPTGQASVHRAHFLNELVSLVPKETAHFGKRLENYTDNGDHVILEFGDGSTAKHSALIACDGIKSRARQILLGENSPAAKPVFSGKYAYRGLIPMDQAAKLLGDDLARNSQLYMGKHGHMLTFPIEKGATMNVVAFQAKRDGKWEDEQWVLPMKKEDMYREFDGWVDAVGEIVGLMQKPDVWALFEHPPAETYTKGRVCLLGDAAHATTPHQGAGAGMAIEDALLISSAMSLVYKAEDIPKAFKAYDTVQRPRSQKLVTTSNEGGRLYEMELPGVEEDTEAIKEHLSRRMKWIWEVDLQANVDRVKSLVSESQPSNTRL